MKKNLLIVAAIMLYCFQGNSQPVLTFANSGLQPGDVFTLFTADTAGILPGTGGANHTWNFSSLDITTTSQTTTYVNPSATPYASSFPTATAATSNGGSYNYSKSNNSETSFLGVVTTSTSIVYSDPAVYFVFPFTYPNTNTDNFAATFISGVQFIRTGTMNTQADGYGTLILPSGSFSTLRIKLIQDLKDSSSYGNMLFHSESYIWYDGFNKTPLLEIILSVSEFMGNITYSKSVYVGQSVAGMNDEINNDQEFLVFPNPASTVLNITSCMIDDPTAVITIIDMHGNQIMNSPLSDYSEDNIQFNISELPEGIYVARITSEKGISVKKFVKN